MEERESKNDEAPAPEIEDGNLSEEADVGTKDASSIPNGESEQNIDGAGSRTFTMRELLNELKNEEAGAGKGVIAENASSGGEEARRGSTAASDGSRRDGVSSFRSVGRYLLPVDVSIFVRSRRTWVLLFGFRSIRMLVFRSMFRFMLLCLT